MRLWFQELFKPSLKCHRLGHAKRIHWREGYVRPKTLGFFGGVADRVRQEQTRCNRCGETLTPWEVTQRKSIDSLSGSTDMWDDIESGGYWIRDGVVVDKRQKR